MGISTNQVHPFAIWKLVGFEATVFMIHCSLMKSSVLFVLFSFLDMILHQHVDGAGKVDGSIVVALPIDRWSASEEENAFEGGGLTFWDGPKQQEIQYDTRSGDLALIDR